MRTVQEELMSAIGKEISDGGIIVNEDGPHLDKIRLKYGEGFPYKGAVETVNIYSLDDEIDYLLRMVDSMLTLEQDKIIMISDSDLSFALVISRQSLERHAEGFLSLPQHKYFFAYDYSSCVFFRMEGDMGVTIPIPMQRAR